MRAKISMVILPQLMEQSVDRMLAFSQASTGCSVHPIAEDLNGRTFNDLLPETT
jgi:hypothetical protein